MNFREEYKNQAEVLNPSPEAMERMTKNILEQVKAPAKKAVPFRKITYIAGAVAACALITIGAARILPTTGRVPTADSASSFTESLSCTESVTAGTAQDTSAELTDTESLAKDGGFNYSDNAEAGGLASLPTNEESDKAVSDGINSDSVFEEIACEAAEDNCAPAEKDSSPNGNALMPETAPSYGTCEAAASYGTCDAAPFEETCEDACEPAPETDSWEGMYIKASDKLIQSFVLGNKWVTADGENIYIPKQEYVRVPEEYLGVIDHNELISYTAFDSTTGGAFLISEGVSTVLLSRGDIVHSDPVGYYCTEGELELLRSRYGFEEE